MNVKTLSSITLFLALVAASLSLIVAAPQQAMAADGDVFYRGESKTIDIGLGLNGVDESFDLYVHFEGNEASIPASAWSALMVIESLPGATGSVSFNPATIVNDEPNIGPALSNPFLGFDDGRAYGNLTGGQSNSIGVLSLVWTALTTDVPNGAGLAAIPIYVAPGTSGDFAVNFGSDPNFTGVAFAGPEPDGSGDFIYPSGTHVSAIISVVPEPSTLLLACLASMTFCGTRRRCRR